MVVVVVVVAVVVAVIIVVFIVAVIAAMAMVIVVAIMLMIIGTCLIRRKDRRLVSIIIEGGLLAGLRLAVTVNGFESGPYTQLWFILVALR